MVTPWRDRGVFHSLIRLLSNSPINFILAAMKIPLLLLTIFISTALSAQIDSIAFMRKDSIRQAKVTARQKRFDIGGGIQVNGFNRLGTSTGLLFSLKANSQTGRIAGLFNLSYNLNNHFNALSFAYNYDNQGYPKSKFYSNVRYNFLKLSAAMQIPFFNRTNKKGFSLAAIVGLSYYNGLGSGEYVSFLDRDNPATIDSTLLDDIRPSQKFNFNNHNLQMVSLDLGLSFNYTYERYQLFADVSLLAVGSFGSTFDRNDDIPWSGWFGGSYPNYVSYNLNLGLRYCLYNPWQTKPPKRSSN